MYLTINPFVYLDVVQFDNTYSWTRSKEVMYSIEVLPPSDLSHDNVHSEDFLDCLDVLTEINEEGVVLDLGMELKHTSLEPPASGNDVLTEINEEGVVLDLGMELKHTKLEPPTSGNNEDN